MDELGNAIGVLSPSDEGSAALGEVSVMAQLDRVARVAARGAKRFGAPLAATLDARSRVAELGADLPGGACYTFVGVFEHAGTSGVLRIEDALARPFAEQRIDDGAHASGPHCIAEGGAHTVRLTADVETSELVAALGVYRHDDPALAPALARISARVAERAEGATPIGGVQRDAIEQGRAVEVPLVLAADECRVVVGAATPDPADFDLEIIDGAEVVMRDIGVDRDPIVGPFCTDHARVIRLRLRAYSESGTVYWRSFAVPARGDAADPPSHTSAQ